MGCLRASRADAVRWRPRAPDRDGAVAAPQPAKDSGTVDKRMSDTEWMPGEETGARGIVVLDGARPEVRPQISAFVWGGKVRPVPTLPFGRWKTSAA